MSELPRSNVHAAIEVDLVCPHCAAFNRPGATVIVYDMRAGMACCAVCAHSGPLVTFQPQGV